jgi:hypothetical protein
MNFSIVIADLEALFGPKKGWNMGEMTHIGVCLACGYLDHRDQQEDKRQCTRCWRFKVYNVEEVFI